MNTAQLQAGGYYPGPWSGEDGGPQRLQAAVGVNGLDIKPGETLVPKASRRLCTGNMVVLRDLGEVYLMHVDTLRDKLGMHCYSHVEKLNPETLKPIRKSPKLPGGTWWPGGFCVHRNGDLYVTFGRWAHRLNPDCELVASYKLPQDLPYNSHVILDNGFIVTKPIASEGSTSIVVLDPDGKVRSNVVASQSIHELYGGIVPLGNRRLQRAMWGGLDKFLFWFRSRMWGAIRRKSPAAETDIFDERFKFSFSEFDKLRYAPAVVFKARKGS